MADEEKKDIQPDVDDAAADTEETIDETAETVAEVAEEAIDETAETVAEAETAVEAGDAVIPLGGEEQATGKRRVDTEELRAIAKSVPPPDAYPKGQGEAIEKRLAEDDSATAFDKGVAAMVKETEALSETAPVKAFGRAISSLQRGIESLSDTPEGHDPHNTDVTVFRGKTYQIPLYTSVFLVLGVLTIIEVLVAEIFTADAITVPVNLGLAATKAFLVVYYYMHLNTDSRVFRWTLLVPVGVGLLSALFLLAIPTGY